MIEARHSDAMGPWVALEFQLLQLFGWGRESGK